MKFATPKSKTPKSRQVREYKLRNDKDVSDCIALLAIFLQNGRFGIPQNHINSNLTRADLYKAPRTKHFTQHPALANPIVYYRQQGLNSRGVDYDDSGSDGESEEEGEEGEEEEQEEQLIDEIDEEYDDDSNELSPNNQIYSSAFEGPESSFSIRATTNKNYTEYLQENDTVDPAVINSSNIEINPKPSKSFNSKSTNKFFGVTSIPFDTSSRPQSSSTSERSGNSSPTKTNIFGQDISTTIRKRDHLHTHVTERNDIFRPDTPTAVINKKLDLFRVETPLGARPIKNLEETFIEPKTPITQTGDFSYDDIYTTPISNKKPRLENIHVSSSGKRTASSASKKQHGLNSPFKTPSRNRISSFSEGSISKNRPSASSSFHESGMKSRQSPFEGKKSPKLRRPSSAQLAKVLMTPTKSGHRPNSSL